MNILFLTDNFPPETNAPARRTYEHCVEWVKAGHEVTVITCAPNFPKGKVFDGYKNKWKQKENIDGIKVIRVWSYITSNSGTVKRILDYISFCITAFLASLFVKTDLIIATSPQFFTAVGGYLSHVFKRKPWYFEIRDLWPESIRAVGAIKNPKILDLLEKIELFLYRKADKLIVVTDSFKENMINRGIEPNKIKVIKNGIHVEAMRSVKVDAKIRKELGLEGKFVIGYIGTHGMAHKLDFVVQASKALPKDVVFVLIGDGAEKAKLTSLKNKIQAEKVLMLDSVPKEEIVKYVHALDVALVNLKKSDTFKTVIPSKIFENAALEKPILLGVEGESKALVESYNAGIAFEPENQEDLIAKIKLLQSDRDLYRSLQDGCLKLAKDFDRKNLALKMLNIIEEQNVKS